MASARLLLDGRPLAESLDLEAEATLAPFAPREHPGAEAFDFTSGSLRARGRLLARQVSAAAHSLTLDLRLADGLLQPGSRLALAALAPPTPAPGAPAPGSPPGPGPGPHGSSPMRLVAAVEVGEEGPLLRLRFEATDFEVGGREGGPPVLQARALEISAESRETRLARLLVRAQELGSGPEGPSPRLAGEFVARALVIAPAGPGLACRGEAERARGRVDLPGLLRQELLVEALAAQEVTARCERVAAGEDEPAAAPPQRWEVRLAAARLAPVREVGFDAFRLQGEAEMAATVALGPGAGVEVRDLRFALPAGKLLEGEETIARRVALRLEARTEPSAPPSPAGAGAAAGPGARPDGAEAQAGAAVATPPLAAVSGSAALTAEVTSLRFLGRVFDRASALGLDGEGRLEADLRLGRGRLLPGSRLEVQGDRLEARLFDSVARGVGRVVGRVEADGGDPQLHLEAVLGRFSIAAAKAGDGRPYFRGSGLRLSARSADALALGAPVADVAAVLDLPEGEVPDLSVYNRLLPPRAGIEIVEGAGRARLHLELLGATHSGRGELAVSSEAARLRVQDLEVAGRFVLEAPLVSADVRSRRFDSGGARLELAPVTYREVGEAAADDLRSWWARAELPRASVVWGSPATLGGTVKLEMQDSGLLLALFSRRRHFLRWFDEVLTVEGVRASGELRLDGSGFAVDGLRVTGGNLEVASRLRLAKGSREGDLFLRYGRLEVGIELRGGQRDWKLLRPREWFESWWGQQDDRSREVAPSPTGRGPG
jgi:hypothetical protein